MDCRTRRVRRRFGGETSDARRASQRRPRGLSATLRKFRFHCDFPAHIRPPAPLSLLILCLTSFAVCGAGALIPVLNTEVYLIGASALVPRPFWAALVVSGTVGAMAGKLVLYYAGRGVVRLPSGRMQRGVAGMQARMEARPGVGKLLYVASATAGLPPFYLTSIAAGAVEMNLAFFLVAGFLGRLLRFAAVVALPHLATRLWVG
jgi:membrane protein YqaA with SNARE-associated domain